jgi:hypothetical protein
MEVDSSQWFLKREQALMRWSSAEAYEVILPTTTKIQSSSCTATSFHSLPKPNQFKRESHRRMATSEQWTSLLSWLATQKVPTHEFKAVIQSPSESSHGEYISFTCVSPTQDANEALFQFLLFDSYKLTPFCQGIVAWWLSRIFQLS